MSLSVTQTKNSGNVKFTYYKKLNDIGRNFNSGLQLIKSTIDRENEQHTNTTRNINTDNEVYKEILTSRDELIQDNTINYDLKYSEPLGNNHFVKFHTISSVRNDLLKM